MCSTRASAVILYSSPVHDFWISLVSVILLTAISALTAASMDPLVKHMRQEMFCLFSCSSFL